MRIFNCITHSVDETKTSAQKFAKAAADINLSAHALVIALIGELGSGKTIFAKGFIHGCGVRHIVQSPTFILVKKYKLPLANYKFIFHIDAYRLKDGNELRALGWDEWIKDRHLIILVEWADRVKEILPKRRFEIRFEHITENKRKIVFSIT